jgi:hypothetical protein
VVLRGLKVRKALLGLRASLAPKVCPGRLAQSDRSDHLALPDRLGLPVLLAVLLVLPAQQVLQVQPDRLAQLDHKARKAQLAPRVYSQGYNAWDMVAYPAAASTNFDLYMDFTPGDSSHYFKAIYKMVADKVYPTSGGGFGWDQGALTINPSAANAPVKNRVNYIRFGPYKSLTGGTLNYMLAGKWYLLGIKG